MKYVLHAPKLSPIPGRRRTADSDCPDATWKRLSREQKARLSILARQAYDHQKVQGIPLDEWRHDVSIQSCGVRISEACQSHWADLKSAFQDLAGQPEKAFQTQLREGDNNRRIALHKLTTAIKERNLHFSYAESICLAQFKVPIAQATAKQIWCLFFTVTNRRKKS